MHAAHDGNFEHLTELIQHGADLTCTDGDGNSALHTAVKQRHAPIVQVLLEQSVEVDAIFEFMSKEKLRISDAFVRADRDA